MRVAVDPLVPLCGTRGCVEEGDNKHHHPALIPPPRPLMCGTTSRFSEVGVSQSDSASRASSLSPSSFIKSRKICSIVGCETLSSLSLAALLHQAEQYPAYPRVMTNPRPGTGCRSRPGTRSDSLTAAEPLHVHVGCSRTTLDIPTEHNRLISDPAMTHVARAPSCLQLRAGDMGLQALCQLLAHGDRSRFPRRFDVRTTSVQTIPVRMVQRRSSSSRANVKSRPKQKLLGSR